MKWDRIVAEFKKAVRKHTDFSPFETIDPNDERYTAYPVFLHHPHLSASHLFATRCNGWVFRQFSPFRNQERGGRGQFDVFFRKLKAGE